MISSGDNEWTAYDIPIRPKVLEAGDRKDQWKLVKVDKSANSVEAIQRLARVLKTPVDSTRTPFTATVGVAIQCVVAVRPCGYTIDGRRTGRLTGPLRVVGPGG